ncbi:hypothetical protein GCM10009727_34630 [Actinomadura napierensis]|uniref:Uncharacterized protein n=1 Tax=Actinomadura napierensis TaxID=267854 RepID=A0ABN2Z981_9ACTN
MVSAGAAPQRALAGADQPADGAGQADAGGTDTAALGCGEHATSFDVGYGVDRRPGIGGRHGAGAREGARRRAWRAKAREMCAAGEPARTTLRMDAAESV